MFSRPVLSVFGSVDDNFDVPIGDDDVYVGIDIGTSKLAWHT